MDLAGVAFDVVVFFDETVGLTRAGFSVAEAVGFPVDLSTAGVVDGPEPSMPRSEASEKIAVVLMMSKRMITPMSIDCCSEFMRNNSSVLVLLGSSQTGFLRPSKSLNRSQVFFPYGDGNAGERIVGICSGKNE